MKTALISGFVDELEKIGFIFGAEEPEHPFSPSRNIPYSGREKDYLRYARTKGKEDPTPWWKALLGGGAVGTAVGAPIGAGIGSAGTPRSTAIGALIGAGIGAGLGTLVGAGMRQGDVAEIEHARRMTKDKEGRRYYIRAGIGSREAWERDADRRSRIEAARETGKAIGEGITEARGSRKMLAKKK